ncbi:PP2C family protein-serine/threonine phosphatase [Amycolatopsis sp. BJA-103]|uniref:PP2C family protein-serine/threonine phosphatase n=1 Tax=unclassified Amycolatopsis TaxID=2618356 RepID=UPI000C786C85|nr:PP2C family protein-serine/threonine phosphatase [Amycolatopsis sp. BJA-103]AUI59752.1 translation initiation factor IF-2 [Amycolatopsis sp. BJA-103]PNE14719.1 translation initiation factor IF-2 [Amycolatopsis sp. BJA-103]
MTDTSVVRLRRRVREVCAAAGVPAEQRARLVLAVSLLAENGPAPELSTTMADGRLSVTLESSRPVGRRQRTTLPLLPAAGEGTRLTWHLDAGAEPVPAADDDEVATRDEMLALVARADAVAKDQRELKHELAETNSGVLAMYVELEERDEQLRKAHAVIFRELEDALRPPPPPAGPFELAVHYAPSQQDSPTGGDLYDWFVLPDGCVHITLVDAVGHGVTSTRHALTVTHAIRTLALEGHPFRDLIGRTARTLATIEPDLMATVLLARLDPATGEVTFANGSHPRPVLVTDEGTELLAAETSGRGIGFPDPGSRSLVHRTLADGDLLVIYTDGLVESRKDFHEGEIRLLAAARRNAGRPTSEIPDVLATEMLDIVLHADDTVVIAIRRSAGYGDPDEGRRRTGRSGR